MENCFEDMENSLKEVAKSRGRVYYKCETVEDVTKLLENPDVNSGDIISFVTEINGEPTICYGSVSGMPEDDRMIHPHVAIISTSSQVKSIVDSIMENPEELGMLPLEAERTMFHIPDIEELKESKYIEDNRKWYDRYDRRGRKKVRKYT